tara:strand:- start:650 stop:883 length:234 start_codon:yes stop_codon:yes gene_type:complete
MKTLYDKLKPEYKQKLEKQAEQYPSLIQQITESLQENYFWSSLTVGQAKDLITFTDYSFGEMSSHDFAFGDKFFLKD